MVSIIVVTTHIYAYIERWEKKKEARKEKKREERKDRKKEGEKQMKTYIYENYIIVFMISWNLVEFICVWVWVHVCVRKRERGKC